jgi:hypothetical protein
MKKGVIRKIGTTFGLAVLLSSGPGCKIGELLNEAGPYESVPINPIPQEYRQWWQEMENCGGRTRNFSDINWLQYPVTSGYVECDDKERGCLGFYDDYRRRIHIREDFILVRGVVGHEILHALGHHDGSSVFKQCGVL